MKRALGIIIILILVGVSIGLLFYFKPHTKMEKMTADEKVTAVELYESYVKDEQASDKRYLDKVVEVDGVIKEVELRDGNTASILLESGDIMFGVSCEMDFTIEIHRNDFKSGEAVKLKCICTGYLMDVVLTRCIELN